MGNKWSCLLMSRLELMRAVLALLLTPLQKRLLSWKESRVFWMEKVSIEMHNTKTMLSWFRPGANLVCSDPRTFNNNSFISYLDDRWRVYDAADFDFEHRRAGKAADPDDGVTFVGVCWYRWTRWTSGTSDLKSVPPPLRSDCPPDPRAETSWKHSRWWLLRQWGSTQKG